MNKMTNYNVEKEIGVIKERVDNILKSVEKIELKLEKEYVTHDEFEPYKNSLKELREFFIKILFVILGAIIMAVLGVIIVSPK